MPQKNLTPEEAEELSKITEGADISCPIIARALRAIERDKPWAIHIVPPMGRYSGKGHVPYFGAIATNEGREAIERAAQPA